MKIRHGFGGVITITIIIEIIIQLVSLNQNQINSATTHTIFNSIRFEKFEICHYHHDELNQMIIIRIE